MSIFDGLDDILGLDDLDLDVMDAADAAEIAEGAGVAAALSPGSVHLPDPFAAGVGADVAAACAEADELVAAVLGENGAAAADAAAMTFVENSDRAGEALLNASPEQLRAMGANYAAAAEQSHIAGVIAQTNQDLRDIDSASAFNQDIDQRISDAGGPHA